MHTFSMYLSMNVNHLAIVGSLKSNGKEVFVVTCRWASSTLLLEIPKEI